MRTILSTLSAIALMATATTLTAEAQKPELPTGTKTVDSIKVVNHFLLVTAYDADGNVLAETRYAQYDGNEYSQGTMTTYEYTDGQQTKSTTSVQDAESGTFVVTKATEIYDNGTRVINYEATDGELTKTTTTEMETDENGDMVSEKTYNAAGELTMVAEYNYANIQTNMMAPTETERKLSQVYYYAVSAENIEEKKPVKLLEYTYELFGARTTLREYDFADEKDSEGQYAQYQISITRYNRNMTSYSTEQTSGSMTTSGYKAALTYDENGKMASLNYSVWDTTKETETGTGDWSEATSAIFVSSTVDNNPSKGDGEVIELDPTIGGNTGGTELEPGTGSGSGTQEVKPGTDDQGNGGTTELEPGTGNLGDGGEPEEQPTAVKAATQNVEIGAEGRSIRVTGAEGQSVTVRALDGQMVAQKVADANCQISLNRRGAYIVTVGHESKLVIVK